MTDTPTLPSDRQLVDAARAGHDAAWLELMERHEDAIRACVPRRRRNQRSIDEGLDQLHAHLDRVPAEGQAAVRAFRPRAIATITDGDFGPGAGAPERARIDDDDRLLASAFSRLPEPWQTVLWHTHVEQLTAAEISPFVGRAVKEVGELVGTAERGLIDAYLVEYLDSDDFDPQSAAVVSLLSGHVRGALPPHEARFVEAHLATPVEPSHGWSRAGTLREHTADDSRRLIAVASSLSAVLPPAIAPGITGMSVETHRAALGTGAQPVGEAALAADRSDRIRAAIVVGSVAAVVFALVGLAYLVRQPFDNGSNDTATTADVDPGGPKEPVDDPDATTTTALELRPDVAGPRNEIRLVIEETVEAAGLVAVPVEISATVSSPAPMFSGGTGTIDVVLTNDGTSQFDGRATLDLPEGVTFDAVAGGDASCVASDDGSPVCAMSIAPTASTGFSIRVAIEQGVLGNVTVVGDALVAPFAEPINVARALLHNSVGNGGVTIIGNTLLACNPTEAVDLDISCDDVMNGIGDVVDRWDVPMGFVGATDGFTNSSRATLDLTPDATVVSAHLIWSGDLDERGVVADGDAADTVRFAAPGGDVVEVQAQDTKFGSDEGAEYLASADVTDLVQVGGEYLVGDVVAAEVQGSYAGWALVVVIDDPTAPRSVRLVTEPYDWVAPEPVFEYSAALPMPILSGAVGELNVLEFEGERSFRPEVLGVDGVELGGENPFDSSIVGGRNPMFGNNLGIGIDAYDLTIDTPDGSLDIAATSAKDGFRIAVLGFTVELAS